MANEWQHEDGGEDQPRAVGAPFLLKVILLPLDFFLLTLDFTRVCWWALRQIPRAVASRKAKAFVPAVGGNVKIPGGTTVKECRIGRKYTTKGVLGLLIANTRVVAASDNGNKAVLAWGARGSARTPTDFAHMVSTAIVLAVLWGVPAAAVGRPYRKQIRALLPFGGRRAVVTTPAGAAKSGVDKELSTELTERAAYAENNGHTEEAARLYERAVDANSVNVDALMGLGRTAWKLRLPDQARRAWRSVVDVEPRNVDARVGLGEIAYEDANYSAATKHLATAQGAAPESVEAAVLRARCYLAMRELDDARTQVETAAKLAPHDPRCAAIQGNVELREGKFEEAEEHFRRAIDAGGAVLEARIGLARVLQAKEDLQGAEDALRSILDEEPGHRQTVFDLATLLAGTNRISQAIALLRTTTDDDTRFFAGRGRLAALLLAAGRDNESYKVATDLLKDSPGHIPAHQTLGTLFLRKRLPALTIEHARRALSHGESSVRTFRLLSSGLVADGQFSDAKPRLERLLEELPDDPDIFTQLALCHLNLGELDEAAERLSRAIALRPGHHEVITQLGVIHLRRRDLSASTSAFREALSLQPTNAAYMNNLAVVLADTPGALDEAKQLAMKASQALPDSPPIQDTLGWILLQQGRTEEALRLLEVAAERLPRDGGTQYHYAVALQKSGKVEEARDQARRALAVSDNFYHAEKARQLAGE